MRIQTAESILSHWSYSTPKALLVALSAGLLVQSWLGYKSIRSKNKGANLQVPQIAFCLLQLTGMTLISHTLKERSLYAKVKTNAGFTEDYNMETFLPSDPLVLLSTKRFQSTIALCLISCAPGAIDSLAISLLPTNNKRDTIPQPSGSHNSGQRSAPTSM
jgi:hypothetical protein